jgi:hypothetical protein
VQIDVLKPDQNQKIKPLALSHPYRKARRMVYWDALAAGRLLGVMEVGDRIENDCMVCLEPHAHILRLPCEHFVCLGGVLERLRVIGTTQLECFLCRRVYWFENCTMYGGSSNMEVSNYGRGLRQFVWRCRQYWT